MLAEWSLKTLRTHIHVEPGPGDGAKQDFVDVLMNLLEMMKTRLEGPEVWHFVDVGDLPHCSIQSLSFTGLTSGDSLKSSVIDGGRFRLKPDDIDTRGTGEEG